MPTVLISGANRGIGLEFARQYAADGWTVIACCRAPSKADDLKAVDGEVSVHELDVTRPQDIRALAGEIDAAIDILVVNAGYGTRGEGSFGGLDYEEWKRFLDVNLYGAVATAEAFAPHVKKARGKIAFLSSKMGSIADASGGAIAYRTSKTALNMAAKVVAAALADDGVAVAPFHPGWVQTDMGGPNALISSEESVKGLRRRISEMKPTAEPNFLGYDGEDIPW